MQEIKDEESFNRVLRELLPQAAAKTHLSAAVTGDAAVRALPPREGAPRAALLHTPGMTADNARKLAETLQSSLRAVPGGENAKIIASGDTQTPHRGETPPTADKRLPANVSTVFQVISGKGGAGKTTIAAALAIRLAREGKRVALVDADIYGPSFPALFGITHKPAISAESGLMLPERYTPPGAEQGIALMSLGFIAESGGALAWRGPMAGKALTQLFFSVAWPETDIMIVDMPPGTGDAHLTLNARLPVSGAIAVTQPSPLSVADAERAIAFCGKTGVPVFGIIENMAYLETGGTRHHPFGEGGADALSRRTGIPVTERLPLYAEGGAPLDIAARIATEADGAAAALENGRSRQTD